MMLVTTDSRSPARTLPAQAQHEVGGKILLGSVAGLESCSDVGFLDQPAELDPPRIAPGLYQRGYEAGLSGQTADPQAKGEALSTDPPVLSPETRPSQPIDELVTRCLQDLIDDWERKGGRLAYDDVTRMTTKRGLDGHQLASLLDGLAQAGITPNGLQPDTPGPITDKDEGADLDDASAAERDILGTYLHEIGRYPLLWAEDEVRLGRLIATGQEADAALVDMSTANPDLLAARLREASTAGRRAHAELVVSNLRLVVSIAKQSRYASSGLELIDRIQEGNLGLMHAADKFDYRRGYKFSTYATWWIRQSIERGIANQGRLIRLPVHFHDQLVRVLRMQRRLSDRCDREPTLAELAAALNTDPGQVQAVLDWARPTISIDSRAVKDGDQTVGDLLSANADIDGRTDPAEVVLTAELHRSIKNVLDKVLDTRSANIIRHRFGLEGREEQTLEEIGKSLGLTRERIRQLAVKAMEELSSNMATRPLYEYLIDRTQHTEAQPPAGWPMPDKPKRRSQALRHRNLLWSSYGSATVVTEMNE
jgi:RNA polymerase primary sigma factor